MNVGKNIRSYRQNLNMSQEDLADKIYVSRQSPTGRLKNLILMCSR